MKLGRRAQQYCLVGLAAALIIAIVGAKVPQSNKDQEMVKTMMQKTISVCVGRLLIDLPVDARIEFGPASMGSVNIRVDPGYTREKVAAEIAEREAALIGKLNEYERPTLEKRIVVDAINFQTTLLYFDREKPVMRTKNGLPFTSGEEGITVEAFGINDDLFYRFKGEGLSSPKYENVVFDLVKKFESRNASSLPSVPGFCIENAIIHDPIPPGLNEHVVMFASLKDYPDIAIRLDTSVLDKIQESLLERDANNDMYERFPMQIKILSKGARELNGIPGEEVLNRFKENNGTIGHMLMWESLGKPSDALAPTITLELETGRGRPGSPQNSSLSDEAVLQLWQAISSSVRMRPTTAGKKTGSADTPPTVPLGELAATGRTCPQTGQWRCSEPGPVEGGESRFFQQGDIMPAAVLRSAPGLWQRISGRVSSQRVATVWKLTAYDPTPTVASPDTDAGTASEAQDLFSPDDSPRRGA